MEIKLAKDFILSSTKKKLNKKINKKNQVNKVIYYNRQQICSVSMINWTHNMLQLKYIYLCSENSLTIF